MIIVMQPDAGVDQIEPVEAMPQMEAAAAGATHLRDRVPQCASGFIPIPAKRFAMPTRH
jgi:hypothetical protein